MKVDGRQPVVKIVAESLSQHDEKYEKYVPTPLSAIRVGKEIYKKLTNAVDDCE
jgi:hypothetical protein